MKKSPRLRSGENNFKLAVKSIIPHAYQLFVAWRLQTAIQTHWTRVKKKKSCWNYSQPLQIVLRMLSYLISISSCPHFSQSGRWGWFQTLIQAKWKMDSARYLARLTHALLTHPTNSISTYTHICWLFYGEDTLKESAFFCTLIEQWIYQQLVELRWS